MNLSQLRYALAVADTGSFTLAAERCYVTQPTLSNGIAQLEQELEQRLFLRTTRSVSLTDFGKRMLPFINGVLAAQERMVQAAHDSRPEHRILRIGTSPLIKSDWLAALLEGFRREHPETSILLHEQNMADLYRMLDEGRLDFVFGVEGMHKPDRSTLPLYTEPLYFIPRGKRNPVAEPVRLEEVAGEPFIMVPDACGLAQATRKLFRSHRCHLNEYPGEAMNYQVLEDWARLGLGAAILPESKVRDTSGAQPLTDTESPLSLSFEAVWLKQNKTEEQRLFADYLSKE